MPPAKADWSSKWLTKTKPHRSKRPRRALARHRPKPLLQLKRPLPKPGVPKGIARRVAVRAVREAVGDAAKAVVSIRGELPKRIDQMTTLMWVSYSGTKMIYDNRLELEGTKLDEATKKKLAQLITVNTCSSPASRKMIDLGGSYRYVYSDVQAKIVMTVEVDKDKCS